DFRSKQACGGSAANTMVAICQFGGQAFYSCKVANDEVGSFYLEDLINCGVDTNLDLEDRPEGLTGKCLVFVTPDADRTMNTYLGITADFGVTELVPEALSASQYLYIEGYLVSSPTGKMAAIEAKKIAEQAGVKTSLSLSDPNMVDFFKKGLLSIIGTGVDFIFANESEALKMAETSDLSAAIDYLQKIATQFAITRGAKGSLIYDGKEILNIPPVSVRAVDTVGAGDMYAGAFLYGVTQGMGLPQAGNLASRASSKVVTSYGPRLKAKETQALLTTFSLQPVGEQKK
ncbi:MAG: adenosine kinase, partial [Okeania sp. SIO2D1]|nr:adenosine kinase [Okeania sp. SIO2D1]